MGVILFWIWEGKNERHALHAFSIILSNTWCPPELLLSDMPHRHLKVSGQSSLFLALTVESLYVLSASAPSITDSYRAVNATSIPAHPLSPPLPLERCCTVEASSSPFQTPLSDSPPSVYTSPYTQLWCGDVNEGVVDC